MKQMAINIHDVFSSIAPKYDKLNTILTLNIDKLWRKKPFIGYLGTHDKAAYYYLRDSVNGFMTKTQLKDEFENIGFINSEFKSLTLGIAYTKKKTILSRKK